jgi:AcrR family transcriptional regulator
MSPESQLLNTPRRRRTQAERRQEAEQRLLESAMQLVSEKGVAGLTLGEVGEAAGYSRALPAHHFGNKEGLLKALAAYIRDSFSKKNLGRNPKPKAGLEAVFGTAALYLARAQALDTGAKAMSAIIMEASINRGPLLDDVQALNRTTLDFLEEQIRIGIAQGEIRKNIDPAAQAAIIISMLRGLSMLHFMDESVDLKDVESEMLAMLRCRLQAA